ncbi:MAG: prephenate dehydratase, partial [SAR202 cluster bacterium]|nr:prephenate dehydratase [SAR202 cluster bacterium]
AARIWNPSAGLLPVKSIPDVARVVSDNEASEGIVPIENSIEGGVTYTQDLLIHESDLSICGEVIVPIRQCLVGKPGTDMESIKTVISHPQSLAQCRSFLDNTFPNANLVASLSNAKAVQEIMNLQENIVAISSRRAADIYGAAILMSGVEDLPNNETRFVVLSDKDGTVTGKDKTSLCFEFGDDGPGILSDALKEFASRGINLVKIESRPNKRSLGRYVFLVDIEGHRENSSVKSSLDGLRDRVSMMKVFGSYPVFSLS